MGNAIALNDAALDELFVDLWKSSVFDERCFALLTRLAESATATPGLDRAAVLEPLLPDIAFELSTLRNRRLVTRDEQEILRKTVVATFGLSVGSNAATTWMMLSRADAIKLVDFDTIAPSNLNRLRFGWESVGRAKSDVTREQILQIHPFAQIHTNHTTNAAEVVAWLDSDPRPDVIVDEMDDLAGKVTLRTYARERRLPVVQAGDIGDNTFIDVERYDLDPQPELFNGLIPDIQEWDFEHVTDRERLRRFLVLLTTEGQNDRLLESLGSIGTSLGGAPQLGSTAAMAGGVVALTVKKIRLGENVRSGRYWVHLDNLLVADFNAPEAVAKREEATAYQRAQFPLQAPRW